MGFNLNFGDAKDWFTGKTQAGYSYRNAKALQEQQAALNMWLQQQQQTFNSAEAVKQRDWEKLMSDTSYQRVVKDLRKANINPMLALSHGGASTPVGISASSGLSSVSSGSAPSGAGHDPSGMISSAVLAAKSFGEIRNDFAQANKTEKETDLLKLQGLKTAAEIDKIKADTSYTKAETDKPGPIGRALRAITSSSKEWFYNGWDLARTLTNWYMDAETSARAAAERAERRKTLKQKMYEQTKPLYPSDTGYNGNDVPFPKHYKYNP